MTKCSLCNKEGHNKRGCPTSKTQSQTPLKNPIPQDVEDERIQKARDDAERKVREQIAHERAVILKAKEEQKARDEAKKEADRIAKEKEEADKIAKEKAEADKIASTPKPANNFKKDPTLSFIFETIYDAFANMEYMMLRELYATNPSNFRIIGTHHFSNNDDDPHVSFEVKRMFSFKTGEGKVVEKMWMRTYHLYYVLTPTGKQRYTHITQRDRDNKTYVVANFVSH